MNINWKVRIKSKTFWIAIIPAVIVLIQLVASLFGFEIDLSEISGKLVAIVDAIFVILALLGIVVDHTTAGIGDTKQALSYEEPRSDSDVQPVLNYVNTIETEEVPECNSETIEK